MGRRLYVGNLAFEVTGKELQDAFGAIGPCDSVTLITDRATGDSRGFGFVEMASNGDAQKAIQQLNGTEIKGRAIKVNEAREREDGRRDGGGGGRGGARGTWNRW